MSILFPIGTALQYLALGLMIGGLLALGAIVAPLVFKHPDITRVVAGDVMTQMFSRFDNIMLYATLAVVIAEGMRMVSQASIPLDMINIGRYIVIAALTLTMVISIFQVNRKITEMQHDGIANAPVEDQVAFRKVHDQAEKLAKAELALAAILIILTPFATKGS